MDDQPWHHPQSSPAQALSRGPESRAPAKSLSFRLVDLTYPSDALLDLVEAAHRESRFGDIPFSRDKARRLLDAALTQGAHHLIAVAEVRGRPQGFVFSSVGEYLVGTGALIVTINAVYTSKALRRSLLGGRVAVGLFRSVGRWSRGIGAREILLHVTSGISVERSGRTISRLGFVSAGQSYVARVR